MSSCFAYAGILITALLLLVAYPTVTGASNPGVSLLKEFVEGFVIAQRVSHGEISMGGYQIYTVVSGSMTPEIKIGDVIVIKNIYFY